MLKRDERRQQEHQDQKTVQQSAALLKRHHDADYIFIKLVELFYQRGYN